LNGEIVRAAPNPRFNPIADYQWFDGDGYVYYIDLLAKSKPILYSNIVMSDH
jgi:carotenoid cleavage dioxygenase-like enzyme